MKAPFMQRIYGVACNDVGVAVTGTGYVVSADA